MGVVGNIRTVLRLEGAVILALSIFAFHELGGTWQNFVIWFLAPDLAMLGYLLGPRIGAIAYNITHSYIGALGSVFATHLLAPEFLPLALVWAAHIGFDRGLGYGLKYGVGFTHTHLGRIGRSQEDAHT